MSPCVVEPGKDSDASGWPPMTSASMLSSVDDAFIGCQCYTQSLYTTKVLERVRANWFAVTANTIRNQRTATSFSCITDTFVVKTWPLNLAVRNIKIIRNTIR